ncbi:uncharacterized protein LOC111486475 isoform X1 [Cucurbita maxima]|uniref:Uncharacterized protein LOC111486475 isoform X1 n=2 Tax=Cucurbita maxima TaxID=3661 RepID=A0A6J1JQ80_CUCMA|nr:uncharacterized protein LOC111486475 isoform X1 [Cucurbita maxima]
MESQSPITLSQTELQTAIYGECLDSIDPDLFYDDFDSASSTPYVSAHSSPCRGPISGFFYSAPASPMHFAITKNPTNSSSTFMENQSSSFEFDFSARFGSNGGSSSTASMSSADELFHNGKIRPMKLSTHLDLPLAPLLDLELGDEEEGDGVVEFVRGRDLRLRDKLQRRRTRSMSPFRNSPIEWTESENGDGISVECSVTEKENSEESEVIEKVVKTASNSEASTPSISACSSRSSSAGRSSKRWIFLKDFLHRSKSEGRSNTKFWSNISFTPVKEKKSGGANQSVAKQEFINPLVDRSSEGKKAKGRVGAKKDASGKPRNGVGKRRVVPPSPHERHYTANRAHSEEMKKKTYLPYRQGLLGCLGFSSKGYGAVSGFAKALNSVSSRNTKQKA